MKYTQQVWRWTQETLECLLDKCNSGQKHNTDYDSVYKGALQIAAFVFCNSVQLIPNLKQYCTQTPNCCINITNPSLNQWRRCRKDTLTIRRDAAHVSWSTPDGISWKEPGEMKRRKGWILIRIAERPPALPSAAVRCHLHCGAPAPLRKMKFPDSSKFLQSGTFSCPVNGSFVSRAYSTQ